MLNISILDIMVIIAYLAGMSLIGVYFSRKNKNTEEYFVGGRNFSGWTIGLSLVGVCISSVTFVAFPADAYKTTWMRFLPNFGLPVAVAFAAYVFLPFFRRTKGYSAYEYLEHRYGSPIRIYGSLAFMFAQLVKLSLVHYLVALLFYEITGVSPITCIIVSGVCLAFYTIIGGIDAVIWTDVIQTVILALGGIICLCVIVHLLPGGLQQIFSIASEHGKLTISDCVNGQRIPIGWGLSLSRKTGTMLFLLGLTNWLTEYSGGQTTIQRYYTTKNIHEARKAMWVMAGFCLPIWAFYMFLGTALFAFFTVFPNGYASEMLDGTRKAEQILPYFVVHYLPKGLIGLVLASALAAAMSTLSAIINSVSTTFVVDIYKRYVVKSKNDKHYLRVALLMASFASALMIVGAMILINIKTNTLQDIANILTSLLGGGLLAIYLIGFLTNIGDWRAVLIGLFCTMLFTAWTICAQRHLLPNWLDVPFELYYTTMAGNLIMFVVTVLASFVLPRKQPLADDLTIWTQKK